MQAVEGEVAQVDLELQPLTNLSARGWYNGSTHVHMNYAGNLHNTLENLMMMSAAEDQDMVNEQIANKDNRILDHQYFVPGGKAHPLSTRDRVLVVGQEYRPPFYGHVFMFQLRDHLISPFTTGYEGTAIESLYPSNTDMFRKAKAQGATVGYVHAFGSQSADQSGRQRPARRGSRRRQGLHRRRRAADHGRRGVVDLRHGRASIRGTPSSTTGCASRPSAARTRSAACIDRSWSAPRAPTSTPASAASTRTPGSKGCGRDARSSPPGRSSSSRSTADARRGSQTAGGRRRRRDRRARALDHAARERHR